MRHAAPSHRRSGPTVGGLASAEVPRPEPKASQILIEVTACGVCHRSGAQQYL